MNNITADRVNGLLFAIGHSVVEFDMLNKSKAEPSYQQELREGILEMIGNCYKEFRGMDVMELDSPMTYSLLRSIDGDLSSRRIQF